MNYICIYYYCCYIWTHFYCLTLYCVSPFMSHFWPYFWLIFSLFNFSPMYSLEIYVPFVSFNWFSLCTESLKLISVWTAWTMQRSYNYFSPMPPLGSLAVLTQDFISVFKKDSVFKHYNCFLHPGFSGLFPSLLISLLAIFYCILNL